MELLKKRIFEITVLDQYLIYSFKIFALMHISLIVNCNRKKKIEIDNTTEKIAY